MWCAQTTRQCSCAPGECDANRRYLRQLADVIRFSTPKQGLAAFFAESIQVGESQRRFCRAILCISAAYAVTRCPSLSVCLSVTFVYSVETNKHLNIFPPSGSHTILVFRYQTLWQYSDGDPLTGAKIAIFDQYLHALAPITAGPSRVVNISTMESCSSQKVSTWRWRQQNRI